MEQGAGQALWAGPSSRGRCDAGVMCTVTHSFLDSPFTDSGAWPLAAKFTTPPLPTEATAPDPRFSCSWETGTTS